MQDVQDLTENTCELTSLPTVMTYNLPIQIGFIVYQYTKLKMLMFYYDFLTKDIDRHDFQLCEMDTDIYISCFSELDRPILIKVVPSI